MLISPLLRCLPHTFYPALYTYYNIVLSAPIRKQAITSNKKRNKLLEYDPMIRFFLKKLHFYLDKLFILLYCVKYKGSLPSVPTLLRCDFQGKNCNEADSERE